MPPPPPLLSPEMVRLAREQNRASGQAGRREVHESEADRLPFPDALCTCAVTTGVFGFPDRPDLALAEMYRVLRPGGRLVVFSSSKELRGTPAAPEPFASRIRFYEDDELVALARRAGFVDVRADRPESGRYARAARSVSRERTPPSPATRSVPFGPRLLVTNPPPSSGVVSRAGGHAMSKPARSMMDSWNAFPRSVAPTLSGTTEYLYEHPSAGGSPVLPC